MSPKRWRRIEKLYHSALEHEPENRAAFLDDACGDDNDLRERVAILLAQPSSTSPLRAETAWEALAGNDSGEASHNATITRPALIEGDTMPDHQERRIPATSRHIRPAPSRMWP
jgi:hypothetical protein